MPNCPHCGHGWLVDDEVITPTHRALISRCIVCGYVREQLNLDFDESCCRHDRREG